MEPIEIPEIDENTTIRVEDCMSSEEDMFSRHGRVDYGFHRVLGTYEDGEQVT